jgi:short-subunit dehydrogenase
MNLENQTALITGSSGGIGEDFAVEFAKRKVNLVLVARREDKLAQSQQVVDTGQLGDPNDILIS